MFFGNMQMHGARMGPGFHFSSGHLDLNDLFGELLGGAAGMNMNGRPYRRNNSQRYQNGDDSDDDNI